MPLTPIVKSLLEAMTDAMPEALEAVSLAAQELNRDVT
jgi:hypothetical protein